MREVGQALHQCRGGGFGQREVQAHIAGMRGALQAGTGGGQFAPHRAFERVGQAAVQVREALQRDLVRAQQGLGDGVGVRTHQAARPQLDAAKVAHHGGLHAFKVLVAQHVEHGAACGAAGLAVVHRGRLPARQQRPADVGGAGVFLPQRIDMGLGAGPVRHGLHAADEAAFLDEEFAVDGGCKGVGHGAVELTLRPTQSAFRSGFRQRSADSARAVLLGS